MSQTLRKLTTIFSADVQGYSRLMEADEEGTLATLKQYRDAMAKLIEGHGGRVVNTWGDGLLAEFPSVVEALRAAIDVQNDLAGRNAGRSSETRMQFRIGINLGDVIVEGDDIYGDGVNIAARLQSSATPGGIVISNTVYDQVRNKVAVGFDFLGQLPVKNIEEGVPSYAVRIGETERPPDPAPRNWGRNAEAQVEPVPTLSEAKPVSKPPRARILGVLGVVAAGLVTVNLLSWDGEFWARWPLLGMALAAAAAALPRTGRIDRPLAMLGLVGLFILGINLLSWHGEFWARWPLLGIAIAAGIRWVTRQGRRQNHTR
ncbi:adenylate cyclase [Mesorhizobium sp. L-8-10]|uniref:adenylate/guanylate cyclase domain-containing protein n=1 Tax=unclassified Mesorhizobium TaxID=325217 RepID=UPI0019261A0E|nr:MULTISPECIES: adenylate/guanylate cyclase domain-containing protein [unclassified Mesorhizobium]BCH26221.1 adenylate cyclase [Mesorhizobium sp. L-8-3]BCH34205.1 adenylate cyclase [Mesorhizobium sp. L-8-10]